MSEKSFQIFAGWDVTAGFRVLQMLSSVTVLYEDWLVRVKIRCGRRVVRIERAIVLRRVKNAALRLPSPILASASRMHGCRTKKA